MKINNIKLHSILINIINIIKLYIFKFLFNNISFKLNLIINLKNNNFIQILFFIYIKYFYKKILLIIL
jgi:hypothetical protein